MSSSVQAIRGMNDMLPAEAGSWHFIETAYRKLMQQYGYIEMRMPIVEKTELFKRSIGEVTDIVEKEMYTFEDRNGDSLTLRPEGTAGCVRACIQHGLLHNQTHRVWYMGPMFRHERPQKGRYRQFYQMGVEVYGLQGPDIDAEVIAMTTRFWDMIGLSDKVTLELNSLGSPESRNAYRELLVEYFAQHKDKLDEDSLRRLESNPLRILDSKNPDMREIIELAPKLNEHLDDESKQHLDGLCKLLDQMKISYTLNPYLVRGLDYYSRTVFEWVTTELGAQGTVCAGGRYDGLVEQLGGKPTAAVGFAMGVERLVALAEQAGNSELLLPDAYILAMGDKAVTFAVTVAEMLRNSFPDKGFLMHCGGGSMKSQMKKADKSQAQYAIIIGEDEADQNKVTVKSLRKESGQELLDLDALVKFFEKK